MTAFPRLEFPHDENGDVLRRMLEDGDDLSIAREIDFTVVFPGEKEARRFAMHFEGKGFRTECERTATEPDLPWDVVVVRRMVPDHRAIGEFEAELQAQAGLLGGRNDGWGCFAQDGHPH